jgi:hypothetical protein
MRYFIKNASEIAPKSPIRWFADKRSQPFVLLDDPSAAARRPGQGQASACATALPLTQMNTGARSLTSACRPRFRIAMLLLANAVSVAASGAAAPAQAAPTAEQTPSDPYAAHVAEAARRFGVPAALIRAIVHAESRGESRAVSPKGAMGLMQIMPETWAGLRERYVLGRDPFDPHDNILAGTAFLRELYDRYSSPGFLAAYSAGPGRYEDYRDRHRPLPSETLAYVAAVLPLAGDDAFAGDDNIASPVFAASTDPIAWTQAPLFIVRSNGAPAVDHTTLSRPPNDAPVAVAAQGIAPLSDGLFVALTTARRIP